MSKIRLRDIGLLCVIFVAGCEAMFVPETNDPAQKLKWAQVLNEQQGRPLPAERLIEEAISTYNSDKDTTGLAEAYRSYGFFFRSATVSSWEGYYREHRFRDADATFDTRFQKSIEYFQKAEDIYKSDQRADKLSNVHFNMGITYRLMGDKLSACAAFNESLEDNKVYVKAYPDATFDLPPGVASYQELVARQKSDLGC